MNKKNSRSISVDGNRYRWAFFENSGWNDLTVQSESGAGRKLAVSITWDPNEALNLPYKPITSALVAEAIKFAISNGWNSTEQGSPFKCKYVDDKFHTFDQ